MIQVLLLRKRLEYLNIISIIKRSIIEIFCFAALMLMFQSAEAQRLPLGCDENLLKISTDLEEPYQPRAGNAYCDGSIPIQNRGELRIVSLTLGKIAFTDGDSLLQVDRVATLSAGEVYIRGEDKRAGKSYRLDGSIPVEGLSIDLDASIRRKMIGAADLGLLAWTETAQGRLYLPVWAGPVHELRDAVLTVRTPSALIQAVIQICDLQSNVCGPEEFVAANLRAGSLMEIPLTLTSSARKVEVKLTTLAPGNRVRGENIKVFLPGRDV